MSGIGPIRVITDMITGDLIRVITDEQSGVTLTLHRGPVRHDKGMRTRFKLAKPDGTEFDLSPAEWLGVLDLIDRWKEDV
jgi:hypothetical protein